MPTWYSRLQPPLHSQGVGSTEFISHIFPWSLNEKQCKIELSFNIFFMSLIWFSMSFLKKCCLILCETEDPSNDVFVRVVYFIPLLFQFTSELWLTNQMASIFHGPGGPRYLTTSNKFHFPSCKTVSWFSTILFSIGFNTSSSIKLWWPKLFQETSERGWVQGRKQEGCSFET